MKLVGGSNRLDRGDTSTFDVGDETYPASRTVVVDPPQSSAEWGINTHSGRDGRVQRPGTLLLYAFGLAVATLPEGTLFRGSHQTVIGHRIGELSTIVAQARGFHSHT